MPRKPADQTSPLVGAAIQLVAGLPWRYRLVLFAVVLVGGLIYFAASRLLHHPDGSGDGPSATTTPTTGPDGSGSYLFCFWNVENLFDDRDDKRRPVDEVYDNAFATDAALRAEKYDHLASALVRLNDGRGPDVLACAEVESPRAAELLKDALNAKLAVPALRYTHVAMKDLDAGRHIAPCVISRLPLALDRTRLHGRQLRILETHVDVNGYDLFLVASHWTSQLRQRDGTSGEAGRDKYAATIYDVFAGAGKADPRVDFLVCGDFNDTPDSEAVTGPLHAVGDRARVTAAAAPPVLLDLLGDKRPSEFGTLYYNKPLIYDHVCVSAGMLDGAGWGCDPDSVRAVSEGLTQRGSSRREPWRFGNPGAPPTGGRGYSDHFPVTVRLAVRPPAGSG